MDKVSIYPIERRYGLARLVKEDSSKAERVRKTPTVDRYKEVDVTIDSG